jgi:hypothetical protein
LSLLVGCFIFSYSLSHRYQRGTGNHGISE